ncbi:membrane protein [Arthrobacter phage BaileyBlu]|uniref:Membrane protein n=1 Tax=Arthrobacter phage BaileyBlu TaxID=2910754 RepID=A0AA49BNG0_9CAUD|nr:membrane protein [Arthrobacter phage BaileyBlu]UJQ87160.1 membrane protein [Arthrobacter phage BaileyBlu]
MKKLSTREPLIIRGAIVAAITGVIHALVVLGVLPLDTDMEAAVAGAVDLLGTAVLVIWTRGAVTPVADPRDVEIEAPADGLGT